MCSKCICSLCPPGRCTYKQCETHNEMFKTVWQVCTHATVQYRNNPYLCRLTHVQHRTHHLRFAYFLRVAAAATMSISVVSRLPFRLCLPPLSLAATAAAAAATAATAAAAAAAATASLLLSSVDRSDVISRCELMCHHAACVCVWLWARLLTIDVCACVRACMHSCVDAFHALWTLHPRRRTARTRTLETVTPSGT